MKEIHFKGFVLDVKEEQASNWDIDDAQKALRISEAKKQ